MLQRAACVRAGAQQHGAGLAGHACLSAAMLVAQRAMEFAGTSGMQALAVRCAMPKTLPRPTWLCWSVVQMSEMPTPAIEVVRCRSADMIVA